jgi:hypothetical protein
MRCCSSTKFFIYSDLHSTSFACLADAVQHSSATPMDFAAQLPAPMFELAEGLETPIQSIYLTALLGFLSVGAYLVVRQVLIRNELEEAAKSLGERIRTGQASCEVRTVHVYQMVIFGACASRLISVLCFEMTLRV